MRVLRAGNWYRPGWVGAACDARVLGLHAAHVRGCRRARLAAVRAKGGGEKGRAHLVLTPDSKPDSQGGGWRPREWYRWNALEEHVLIEPRIVS